MRLVTAGRIAACCVVAIAFTVPAVARGGGISGVLSSFGYGYEVEVALNGKALPQISGGGSQSVRVFSTDHPMKERMPADVPAGVRATFCLEHGTNRIRISFTRVGTGRPLEVAVAVPALSESPLFRLASETTESAEVEIEFDIPEPGGVIGAVEVSDDEL